jgi:hypothetical protein
MRGPRFLALTCLLTLAVGTAGSARASGTLTGGFPRLDPGARTTALGGSLVALADGCESIRANPAGLLGLSRREAAFTYSDLFGLGLVTQSSAQLGWPRARRDVRWENGRIQRVSLPPPAERALGLDVSTLRGDLTGETYLELQAGVAYAWRLTDRTRAGLAYRLLLAQSGFKGTSGDGHALDLGVQRPLGPLTLGLQAANFVSTTRWAGSPDGTRYTALDEPLARRWSLGLAWQAPLRGIAATVQGDWEGDRFHARQRGAGLEWKPMRALALRAGYRARQDMLGWRGEPSGGVGVTAGGFRLDYGWQPGGHDLGETHRWTAGVAL